MSVELLVTTSIVLAFAYLACIAGAAIVAALRAGARQEDTIASHEALSVSRFTIPVSVIVPVFPDSPSVSETIAALLGLNYPELEVVVVGDGTRSRMVETLAREWALEANEFFFRRRLDTADVRRIYRSTRDGRLMVIDKAAGGYGDALNCGVNVARYRYVMSMAPGIVFDSNALLRIMSAALRDPADVVGASGHVEHVFDPAAGFRAQPATGTGGGVKSGSADSALSAVIALFQRLGSLRSLMDSRLVWRSLRCGLGPAGAVAVWRRDAVIDRHGFSTTAADAALDMMFRLQTVDAAGSTGRFDRGDDVFGSTPTQSLSGVIDSAGRRQRATLQLLWMHIRGGSALAQPRSLAYFVASELVTPLAQTWVVVGTGAGAAAGWFGWSVAGLALVLLSFGNASVTAAALFLRGARLGAPEGPTLRRLLIAGPLEFVLYRPVLAGARFAAACAFVFGRG